MASTLAPATGIICVSVTTPVSAPVVTPWASAPVSGSTSSASRIRALRVKHGSIRRAFVRYFIRNLSKTVTGEDVPVAAGNRPPTILAAGDGEVNGDPRDAMQKTPGLRQGCRLTAGIYKLDGLIPGPGEPGNRERKRAEEKER